MCDGGSQVGAKHLDGVLVFYRSVSAQMLRPYVTITNRNTTGKGRAGCYGV